MSTVTSLQVVCCLLCLCVCLCCFFLREAPMGTMFILESFVFGTSCARINWEKGHYTEGAELIDEVVDVIRKESAGCDCSQEFHLKHSLGGGTGSGLGTLLLMKIRDNYPDRITATFSVYPSPKVSDVVVEPYNATLSIHQLLENSDETFVIDNEALYNISHNIFKQQQPKYVESNWVIPLVVSGICASAILRFSGNLNGDLRKTDLNLVSFLRLHFNAISQAPLFASVDVKHVKATVQEIRDQKKRLSSRNFLANFKPEDDKYLSVSCCYRSNLATQEVDDKIANVQQKMGNDSVTLIPNNIKSSIITVPLEIDR